MRRLWHLAIANWWTSPGRSAATIVSVMIGVATVVTITSFYETTYRAIEQEVVKQWLGSAHLSVQPIGAHWGSVDTTLAEAIAELNNVRHVTTRLRRRMFCLRAEEADELIHTSWWYVDAVGIDPTTERHFQTLPSLEGRMMKPGERGVAVIEREVADEWGAPFGGRTVPIGGQIILSTRKEGPGIPFTVVGKFDSRRLAEFQQPSIFLSITDVQQLVGEPSAASVIDIMLNDSSAAAMSAGKEALERLLADRGLKGQCQIETGEARQMILGEAEKITRLTLMLMASIALLTSFFIILTTMSMSLYARRQALGVMRCIGMTRGQLATMLLMEIVPLGVVGTGLGVLLGVGVTMAAGRLASDVFIRISWSQWGIALAVISGLSTTLLSGFMLIIQVSRVTPLAAINIESRPARLRYPLMAGMVGIALLVLHEALLRVDDPTLWLQPVVAGVGTASLYLGYILVAPAMVVLLGPTTARVVGPLMGLRARLAVEQFGRSPWRSTGVCWVLMVGLSLMVYVSTQMAAMNALWDVPARLPGTFVWTKKSVPGETIERVRAIPGVKKVTAAVDVSCTIESSGASATSEKPSIIENMLRKLTRPVFIATDPHELLGMVKVVFTQGTSEDALEKLGRGGHIIIPEQTARYNQLHLGDKVSLNIRGRSAEFEVAGVIQSPALDVAVTAFNAASYMQFAASNAMIGTREDLKEKFGLDVVSMYLCDLDLPPTPTPEAFTRASAPNHKQHKEVAAALLAWQEGLPHERVALTRIAAPLRSWLEDPNGAPLDPKLRGELRRYARAISYIGGRWNACTPDERWEQFRERLVLINIAEASGVPDAIIGSMTRLRKALERAIDRATMLFTWVPSLALLVASIGIANLMMISVHLRSRQIAVLRAVGALKSQIIRLVLAEAIALGLLGSVMGVALGLHASLSDSRLTGALAGFDPEFHIQTGTVAAAVALTVFVCLIAGLAPARRAARENIVAAMQTT